MARVNIASGLIPNNPLTVALDTQGKVKCVSIQNVSSVDIYVSENPNTLQNTSPANLPQVGHHFPPDSVGITPFILVLPQINAKLYARSAASGGQLEVIQYDLCSDEALGRKSSQ